MSQTTHTPTTPTPPPTPPAGRDRSLRIALIALGSALILALVAVGGIQFALASTGGDDSGSYTEGASFTQLEVDSSAADVTVRYGAVTETQIEFDSGGAPLRYEQRIDGDTLEVGVKSHGWWIFGALGGFGFDRSASLDITLPLALAPLDVDVDSSAGDTDLDGDFGALELDSSAGEIRLAGSAASLSADSSAGSMTGDLEVTGTVETESSAGSTDFTFRGLPSSIRMESSAGNVRVALPAGTYEIRTDTAAGSVEQGLVSTPGAPRVYSFESSAGNIVLLPTP